LSVKNIDLKNGHFGESGAFIDSDGGLNVMAKRNMVMFMNKLLSGSVDEPLSVEGIVSGVSMVEPVEMKNIFESSGLINGLGWKYNQIVQNLSKAFSD
jgi:hypothetical protein